MFGFGSMSPFFHDEYLFNDDERPRKKRRNDQDDGYVRESCPDCSAPLKFRPDAEKVRCRNCGGKFKVN
jgi:DNA-directed RNA polymerase subunit RPC12/RpoP